MDNKLIKLKSHEGFHEGWIPITLVTPQYVNVMLMLYRWAQLLLVNFCHKTTTLLWVSSTNTEQTLTKNLMIALAKAYK